MRAKRKSKPAALREYKLGTRLRVEWIDYAGYVNETLRNARPVKCWSEGILVNWEEDHFVLASSQYIDNEPAKEKSGDYTAIIKGGVTKIEII
tara:strand:- start:734 stop:1012 length:279 start_codon:yes stop_codon:yes gene_type:complete